MKHPKKPTIAPITETQATSETFLDPPCELKSLDDRNVRDFNILYTKGSERIGTTAPDDLGSPDCKIETLVTENNEWVSPFVSPREEPVLEMLSQQLESGENKGRFGVRFDEKVKAKESSEERKVFGLIKSAKMSETTKELSESLFFKLFELLLLAGNTAVYCLQDYSDRYGHEVDETSKETLFFLELGFNIAYVLVFMLKIMARGTWGTKGYFRSKFNVFNALVIFASFMIYMPSETATIPFKIIRLARPLLLLDIIKPLKKTFVAFIRTLASIREILFQIAFLTVFFSIFGLHMFQGLLESRCRFTESPENGLWPANTEVRELCGSHHCPEGNYCVNPSIIDFPMNHTEMDIEELNYGLSHFDNILNALLVGLNFFSFTGWSKINDIYWMAYNKVVVAIYMIVFVFMMGLIMMNLLMASFYESFVTQLREVKSKQENHKTKHEMRAQLQEMGVLKNATKKKLVSDPKMEGSSPKSGFRPGLKRKSTFKKAIDLHQKSVENNDDSMHRSHPEKLSIEVFYKGFTFENAPLKNVTKIRNFFYKLITSNFFHYSILLLVLADIVVLASDRAGISDSELSGLEKTDFAITWIFALEIALRLLIFRPRKFFNNYFDTLDLIIIVFNVGLIIWNYSNDVDQFHTVYATGSAIKCLKFLRIFRFLVGMVLWKRGAILFMEMINALYKTKEFIAVITIVMVIFSLIGRELFACRVLVAGEEEEEFAVNVEELEPPRVNYDDFGNSFIATLLIFLNEEWHIIMFQYQRVVAHESAIFFATVVILGTISMMRMYMMLFINSLLHSPNVEKLFQLPNFITEIIDFIKKKMRMLASAYKSMDFDTMKASEINISKFLNKEPSRNIDSPPQCKRTLPLGVSVVPSIPLDMKKKDSKEGCGNTLQVAYGRSGTISGLLRRDTERSPSNSGRMSIKKQEILRLQIQLQGSRHHLIELEGRSLYLFPKDNAFRKAVHSIVNSVLFEKLIILLIILSIITLIFTSPFNDPASKTADTIYIADCVVLSLYFLEILMKIISYGFLLNGPTSFLMSFWNFLDLVIFVLTLLGTVDTKFKFSQYDFKWCRALRIFKLIQFNNGLKEAMANLFYSVPDIISMFAFYLMNLIFFGMIATRYLKDTLHYCEGVEPELMKEIVDGVACFDYGGDWLNRDLNFDKIADSLATLFQISTTEGWMELMFQAFDHVGANKSPITNYNKTIAGFYLCFFIIANVILMNMIIGILVETYLHEKEKHDPASKFSENQKEWSKIKAFIYELTPKTLRPPPENKFRRKVRNICKSRKFTNFILLVTLLNTLLFMLYWHRQPNALTRTLDYINAVFIAIFSIEILMNLISQGVLRFFCKVWNLFDLMIIICSWLGFAVILQPSMSDLRWIRSLANCIQVLRIIRIIKKIRFLRKLFSIFLHILPQIKNIFLLMSLFFVTYGIIGVNFFAFLKPQETVGGEEIHFRNFFIVLINLARISTAEGWFLILNDCARKQEPNFVCFKVTTFEDYQKHGLMGCGNSVAYLYFYSFLIINTLLILNLFVAMILNAADEHKRSRTQTYEYQIDEITAVWRTFDPKATGYLNYRDFERFYKVLAFRIGVDPEEFLEPETRAMFLKYCSIPLYEHRKERVYCVRFHDCVMKLAQMAVFLGQGKKDLEPEEGFHHLAKQELKLVSNPQFELSPFKFDEVANLRKVFLALLSLKVRKSKPILSFAKLVRMAVAEERRTEKKAAPTGCETELTSRPLLKAQ